MFSRYIIEEYYTQLADMMLVLHESITWKHNSTCFENAISLFIIIWTRIKYIYRVIFKC